jgi:acyl transferase domain-containing protein/NADPH:quinone reductase-like Zn-dependent oxidoreductase
LPGESYTPSKLWDNLLRDGKSAWSELPKNRFNLDAWYHPNGSRPGSVNTRGGYFLSHDDHLRQFDPSFFGISPLEASSMDPQQRKLLEVVYESVENAGATLEELSGSKTSCFVGCFTNDMRRMTSRDLEFGAPYEMTGSDMTILSNRINYVFNLKGPSMTVDTACSSSLYALHLACQSLISGDSDAAIVGGSNIINDIEQHIFSVRLGVLSPTSTCHTFDERADGFGRGEGICAIYLKKLSDAIANKDPIRAVIRSTAVNSNGKSQGINHPSSKGQEAIIREAYAKANLRYEDTGYFECHGTGTPVGDPIEVLSAGNVFASSRTSQNPLLLSSIKTNIGHTEGASGLASVIKAVLSIENSLIPATVGVQKLNSAIDFKEGRLKVVRTTTPWPEELLERVSINSFGYGGANAHCIIESPNILLGPSYAKPKDFLVEDPKTTTSAFQIQHTPRKHLLVISSHDQNTFDKNINALAEEAEKYELADIAYTLTRKTKHRCKAFATMTESDIKSHSLTKRIQCGAESILEPLVVAFVFTGQGAQWPGMGYGLIEQYEIVRKTMATLQSALDALPTPPDWQIVEELSKTAEKSRMHETALAQPLSTALQIALTVLLQSWGIRSKAVVGHSSGEVAAAFAAGLLTSSEAIAVAYYRGIAVTEYGKPGAMMAVGLGPKEVQAYMMDQPDVVVACHNSPQSVTLSGGADAIVEVHARLSKARVFSRILNTSQNAYHSHLVKDAGQYYEDSFKSSFAASSSVAATSRVPMYSCINGKVLSDPEDVRIAYWRKNLENPVNFTQALSSLIEAQPTVNCLIEVGMHSALVGPIKQIRASLNIKPEKLLYLPSIIRGEDNVETVLKLAGSLWTADYPIDMKAINGMGNFLPNLPAYQWNYDHDLLWTENRLSRELRFRKHARHDLLGSLVVPSSDLNPTWRNRLRIKDVPWLSDHRIGNDVIFPAAGYCAVAIEAVTQFAELLETVFGGFDIQHLKIKAPLVIPTEGEVETLLDLHAVHSSATSASDGVFEFSFSSVNAESKCTEHAFGKIVLHQKDETPRKSDGLDEVVDEPVNMAGTDESWYTALANIGLHYGSAFRTLNNIQSDAEEAATAQIDLQPTKETMVHESRYAIHPACLDGCIQLAVIASCGGNIKGISKAYLPTTIENLTIWRTCDLHTLPVRGVLSSRGACLGMRSIHGSSELLTLEGRLLARMTVSLLSLEGDFASQQTEQPREPFTRLVWQPIVDLSNEQASLDHHPDLADDGCSRTETLWLVYKNSPHPLAKQIETCAKDANAPIGFVGLSDMRKNISKGSRIIMLAELEGPLLISMTDKEMDGVKTLFSLASSIVWVTPGGLLEGKRPEYSLFSGVIKSIMKAQPSLRISSIDIELDDDADIESARLILQHEMSLRKTDDSNHDNQLVISEGVVYASRYVVDEIANHDFVRQLEPTPEIQQIKNNQELAFRQVGSTESFYFQEKSVSSSVEFNEIKLRPIAYALGQREARILGGTQVAPHFSNVCVAVVEDSGSRAEKFKSGDRVVCFRPGKFDTSLILSETACELLLPEEDTGNIVTSLLPYCTALLALRSADRGQTILVHELPELLATAVARLSRAYGLKVVLTHASEEDEAFFAAKYPDLGAYAQCITGAVIAERLSMLTKYRGVDVALINAKSSSCSEIWQSLAGNGRLIYILEDAELPNLGLLDSSVFARGASVTSFNMYDMLATRPEAMNELLFRVLFLLRQRTIPMLTPDGTYDISYLPAAVTAISQSKTKMDVVLTYDRQSMVPIHMPYKQIRFSSESSYLLVGCLGGLGRSLVRWMFSRGARHFVFLSRSGLDKCEAAEFVIELEKLGGKPIVVRGDVGLRSDVDQAIKRAKTPIKGVMQLAMALTVRYLAHPPTT